MRQPETKAGKTMWLWEQRFDSFVLEDGSDKATSQQLSSVTRSWKHPGTDSPLSIQVKLVFSSVKSLLDLWPPELG